MSLRARLLTALGYLVALVLVAFGVPLAANLGDRVGDEVRTQARTQADVLAAGVGRLIETGDDRRLADLARSVAEAARARVVVVDRAGRVLADSAAPGTAGADYSRRPEVATTLAGRRVQEQRHSDTLDQEILATAAPVFGEGRVIGAVRLTQSVDAVQAATRRTVAGVAAVGLIVLLAALGVAFVLARGITRPIERLRAAADGISSGDLDARAAVEGSEEQRSLARSFNVMTERLGRALRAQGEFVADASHQLRTPLTGLRLRLEEARATDDKAAAGRHLDAGIDELDRMAQTIDELLLLSRTGEREEPGEEVELVDALADARRRWGPAAAARDVALEVASDGGGGAVWCARADLERALDAVLENAIVYTPAGGRVSVQAAGGAIEVLDDGPGLGPGEEEEVFARFRRGSAGRTGVPGSGLGLPIARELMRRWGGDARLANRSAGGARATLTLPPFTGALLEGP